MYAGSLVIVRATIDTLKRMATRIRTPRAGEAETIASPERTGFASWIPHTIIGGLATHVTIFGMFVVGSLGWVGGHSSSDAIQKLVVWFMFIVGLTFGLAMIGVTVWSPSRGMQTGHALTAGLKAEEKLRRARFTKPSLEPSTPPAPPPGEPR